MSRAPRALAACGLVAMACASAAPPTYRVDAACAGGLADGRYVARGPGGDRIEGHFCHGERCGLFTFYSGPDIKVAEFPYRGHVLHGVARVWYLPHTAPDSPHRKKSVASFVDGELHGDAWTWWPSGEPRTAFAFRQGALSGGTAWGPDGHELPWAEAAAMASQDAESDLRLFRALGAIVTANPPHCG